MSDLMGSDAPKATEDAARSDNGAGAGGARVSADAERRPQAQPAGPTAPAQPEQDRRRSGRVVVSPAAADRIHPSARATEDERFLEKPTRPEFLDSDPWRALRILSEFVEGFDALAAI